MDVTFCFLVTKDLVKEQSWRKWFDRLRELNFKFKVISHVSPSKMDNVQSTWLRNTILPADYLYETGWGWVMAAMLALYSYAAEHAPAAWYTFHSESCVPMVTPEKFIEQFHALKTQTILSYCRAWWKPSNNRPNNRANLYLLPSEYHWAHPQWSILCHADLIQIIQLTQADPAFTKILLTGHAAEESFLAVFLYKINNFQNVLNKATTLVDWKRTPNGNNPYTFMDWTDADQTAVAELSADTSKNAYFFLRKVGSTFPDKVLNKWTGFKGKRKTKREEVLEDISE